MVACRLCTSNLGGVCLLSSSGHLESLYSGPTLVPHDNTGVLLAVTVDGCVQPFLRDGAEL